LQWHATQVQKRVIQHFKRKADELETKTTELKAENKRLRKRLNNAHETIEELEEKNETMKAELGESDEGVKIKSRKLSDSKQYRKKVSNNLTAMRAERDKALEKIERLKEELEDRTADVEDWMDDYDRLELEATLLHESAERKTEEAEEREIDFRTADGSYDHKLRTVIYAFIRANVGKDNIAPLVGITMQALANAKITKLPSPATMQRMQTELGLLTRLQLYDALTKDPNANTIFAHDGTTDHGRKIGVGELHLQKPKAPEQPKETKKSKDKDKKSKKKKESTRQSFTLYAREQPNGTAASTMQLLNDAINDLNTTGSAVFNDRQPFTLDRICGTLSDHNTTEKATNKLITAAHTAAKAMGCIECFCWNHK
jgi:hypothetical protein